MSQALKVATGIAKGKQTSPELASKAIQIAMKKAGMSTAQSALLFLTSEFAADPQSAIKAASKAASSTQIIGCSATGIFTEDEWILDGAAAAAMVFSEDIFSGHPNTINNSSHLLTLSAPNAINASWLDNNQLRFGGVSGDATGRGPFSVWHNGKGLGQGYCELGIKSCKFSVGASHGLKFISSPRKITACHQYDLLSIANNSALSSLKAACLQENFTDDDLPYHLLMVAHAKTSKAFERGEYELTSIIMTDAETNVVTLANQLQEDDWLCWTVRDISSAQTDIVKTANDLHDNLKTAPEFALLFSCLGRGPYFYNGNDKDLSLIKALFPKLPIIGFYGNGEIAPILGKNTLLQYSAVLSLFSTKDHLT
jgi:small ligand-binding sensory domain FIST